MSLSELLKKDLVRKTEPDNQLARELLVAAKRDLKAASDNSNNSNYDWALAIAYNSMLSSGRALMAIKGYFPASDSHHLSVVQFCAAILPSDSLGLATSFNRYRARRHDVVYGIAGSVGNEEAKTAIKNAELFLKKITELMSK